MIKTAYLPAQLQGSPPVPPCSKTQNLCDRKRKEEGKEMISERKMFIRNSTSHLIYETG